MSREDTGLLGEWRAAKYLKKQGMRVMERRYRCGHGEIDLICADGTETVFVEVKTRPDGRIGDGVRAVNREKRSRIKNAAAQYLRFHPSPSVRFDVIEISAAGLRHIKNAF
ncbi:MAG: YraN family protein [Clostridia bacterium]|nr:YraN family protein [Clostridia bacterium]